MALLEVPKKVVSQGCNANEASKVQWLQFFKDNHPKMITWIALVYNSFNTFQLGGF
jgi:hypothetical protein